MRTIRLNHRVTIQQRAVSQDTSGGAVETWTDFVASEPANVAPLAGREYYAAQQVNADTAYRITVRYRPDKIYSRLHRVVWEGHILDIESVIERNAGGRLVDLMCRERIPQGFRI